jgi:hypothetical protein
VDDGSGFENRRGRKPTVGSNPTSSAMKLDEVIRGMAQSFISDSELKDETLKMLKNKIYDIKYPYMKSYPYSEPAWEKKMLDAALEVALKEQVLPEEIDTESFGITVNCSLPLRSKDIRPISFSDEENMNNLITVTEVMDD